MKKQKKIAVINDISGFGRCSLTVELPIISHMGVQACPVLTSIFSNHTGFPNYYFDDYTDRMHEYIEQWKVLGIRFDGVASGFLGSERQIQIVKEFLKEFASNTALVIVDPVMGDHGKLYATCTPQLCERMKELVRMADITTPNLTEACALTGTSYKETGWRKKELLVMAKAISDMGPSRVVITGIPQGQFIANYVYERDKEPRVLRTHRVGTGRPGTGDIFASIIASDAINGVPFDKSVAKASSFVKKCIEKSIEMDIPRQEGVCFEKILYKLKRD